MNNFSVSIKTAGVYFHNVDTMKRKNYFDDAYPHYGLFHKTMNFLSSLGFTVTKDPRIEETAKCLSKDHRYGKKGLLEFKAERYPVGFKIKFYQNVVFENRSGGEFDFDEYQKMPYLIKLQMRLTCNKLRSFFMKEGCADVSDIEVKTAEDKIKEDFVQCCHHSQNDMNFSLSMYDGQTSTTNDTQQYHDRDGKLLHNGEIKYFRDINGYLCRGKIYHRLSMMFWIIVDDKTTVVRPNFELFDLNDHEKRGKEKKARVPNAYTEKLRVLHELTSKELQNELKRRKRKY